MRMVKNNCLYIVVKSKLLRKLRERRIKQFEQGNSWAVKQLQYLFFIWQKSFSGHWTSLIWMSCVSYGFDLWRKIHPLFFVTIWSWLFDSNAAVFELKRYTKKRTRSLCQTHFCVLFVSMITWGGTVFGASLSSVLFLYTYSCDL